MIDLTPLDVRNKRGDFKKLMRGYDPQEVDIFLELVAERLEALTRENLTLKERAQTLQEQVNSQTTREQAVQEALVTAQELRADIREQSQREADNIIREAETEGRRLVAEAEAEARTKLRSSERKMDELADAIQELERRRTRFLKEFRQLLEREFDVVEVEEDRAPLEERPIDLELGAKRDAKSPGVSPAPEGGAAVSGETRSGEARPPVLPAEDAVDEAPEDVPPPDAAVDELAAAYEEASAPEVGRIEPPPSPPGRRQQSSLLLYLDPDEEEGSG